MPRGRVSRTRRRAKGPRTRAFIKERVLALTATRPWQDLTLAEICAATGLTVGAFYFHFDAKDGVVEEIATDAWRGYHDSIVARIRAEHDLFAIFHAILSAYYQRYVDDPRLCRLLYSVVMNSDRVYKVWLTTRRALRLRIERAVRTARRERSLPLGMEKFLSHWLLSNVEDFVWNVFMSRGNWELNELASAPDVFIRRQAVLWYRASLAEEPDHMLAKTRIAGAAASRAGRRSFGRRK